MKTVTTDKNGNTLTVITNMQPRELHMPAELSTKTRNEFDYIDEGDNFQSRMFQYKGQWYDTHDAMPCRDVDTFKGWDGYFGDSFFSGVLFKYADEDCETVIVARYYC